MKRFVYFLLTLVFLTVVAFNGYAHEGDDKEKPHKVTSETIKGGHSGDSSQLKKASGHNEQAEAAEQNTMEKDFQTIRREVARSTLFIVIKALALAVAIAGIALVYLKRDKQGGTE